jgi:dTDP-4-amino-4,6-dideoxygalactose transaminase
MPAAMPEICRIAAAHGPAVIEDACQAHGAKVRTGDGWSHAGTMGRAGCFSFYPGKNLGAWGDGGAVATDDEELAERIVRLRNHGRISHYAHEDCGYNSRLDTLQAAVLAAKLKRLASWNERRRAIAASYREMLDGCGVDLPAEAEGFESCYHLFVIRSAQRDRIRRALLREHIECGIHYPVPLHLQPALRTLGYTANEFPQSERLADTVLSLPMHPHMTNLEVAEVADCVTAALKAHSGLAAGARTPSEARTATASRQPYSE